MDIKYAWVHVSSGLQPVGQRPPNPFGLFDMIGNATEWCSDWLNSDYYNFSDEKDPQGPSKGEFKVYRGGSVGLQASAATCSYRTGWKPKGGSPDRGFRCVRVLETEANKEPESGAPSALDKELPEITNEFNIKLKLIPAGSFMMGSQSGEADESPMHDVTITKPFYIGIYEITQEQYYAVMGKNPSYSRGADHPVNHVTREDAEEFCRKLNEHGYRNRDKYRLPTEAEWEYACRAGSTTDYHWGDEMDGSYAWSFHDGNESHPVGQKKPNSWGLYDLSGNVWEWCSDYYDEGYYNRSPQNDPKGPESGVLWVARGGSTLNEEKTLRSAERQKYSLGSLSVDIGFRIVKEYRESPASDAVIDEAALPEEVINSMGMKFKLIPSGSFMMGTTKPDSFEQRTHPMEITRPFYIGIYEVTQREFETVMGKNPSEWGGDNHPVHDVPWEDAAEFCQKLSEKEGVIYRLPTEAEWEYACRAGTTTEYYWGDKMDGNYAWYFKNSLAKKSRLERDKNGKNISVPIELGNSQEVGQKLPNAWGLYDMSGSVWEWCSDTYGRKYPNSPAQHVVRGGAFNRPAEESRSASRFGLSHVSEYITVGFRVVREVEAP